MSGFTILTKLSINMTTGTRLYSKIGFIGLGNMGGHMAKNLLKKGYGLTVYDLNKSTMTNLIEAGAGCASNVAGVSKEADVIISMLPSNQHVLDVYTSENGVLSTVQKNVLLIDSSTVDPSVSQLIASQARERNLRFIDSPVSGGVNAAKDGTLTFMVGGTKMDFNDAKPILGALGSRIVHCGDVGMGQAAKLCNNMLLAISMIGTAEAFNLGQKLGLDAKILANVVNSSTGRCWSSDLYNPVPGILPNVPSSKNYEGGFGTTLMAKDLGLVQSAASRTQALIPLGSLAHQIYTAVINQGFSNKDFSVIYQFLKDMAQAMFQVSGLRYDPEYADVQRFQQTAILRGAHTKS
ncbi:PREDICTED: 3-hydroxyisobutyrate dehydrogenase, mitochondrial isoform X1 [Cyphomyrmex costatus]|uniref:3-hydroxyisobutyrate dehydrogenase, mitochondrial isoform X1 n=1 Tax=Cyphomyrmex costatus TaxID=456900 RepID=UPI0008521D43|nr:PREDICTED: 3-hydroxyisobutyrate dehydrogenase, mitochondrial isoform X1 [Cyphomyrmex costatus]